jgi:phosphonoacetaldehyde hydrolase
MSPSPVQAVVFDWAGTMVDFGSRAPMGAFVEVFAEFGVSLTVQDARGPMGLPKLDHIRKLGTLDHVRRQWRAEHGSDFDEAAARRVYEVFVPLNARIVADYADLVPGAAATVQALRVRGIKIGSTTGYTRDILERILPVAAKQGYLPDNTVCAGDIPAGRPTPLMMYKCFVDLGVWEPAKVIKVDDTAPGFAEGLAAGTWVVGVSLSGNEVGLSPAEIAKADPATVAELNARARAVLYDAGAHHVIDTVADLMPVVDRVEAMIAAGEAPRRF